MEAPVPHAHSAAAPSIASTPVSRPSPASSSLLARLGKPSAFSARDSPGLPTFLLTELPPPSQSYPTPSCRPQFQTEQSQDTSRSPLPAERCKVISRLQ